VISHLDPEHYAEIIPTIDATVVPMVTSGNIPGLLTEDDAWNSGRLDVFDVGQAVIK